MRGLAALVVLAHHALLLLPPPFAPPTMTVLRATPLAPLLAGQPAVIVFFALSGLVLTVALEKAPPYLAYAAARLVRLWLPLAAGVLLAAGLSLAVGGRASGAGLVGWFPSVGFNRPDLITVDLVLRHLALTGRLSDEGLNTVIWSLAIEVRLSLLMPAIVVAVRRGGPSAVAVAVAVGLFAECALIGLVPGIDGRILFRDGLFLVDDWAGTAFATLSALPAFAIGAWIALHRARLAAVPLSSTASALLWLAAFVGLGLPTVAGTALAAGLVLALALRPGRVRSWLERPLPLRCGAISYSLYLVHFPVLFAAANLLADHLPPWSASVLGAGAAIGLAILVHRWIETPAIVLARRVAVRLTPTGGGIRGTPRAPRADA